MSKPWPANSSLRRVDWRFLLAERHFGRVAGERASSLFGALEAIADEVVDIDDPSLDESRPTVAVLADATVASLRRAHDALAPGGACYLEMKWPGLAGVNGLRRRLRAVGFSDVHCYWVWPPPTSRRPQFWIPFEARNAIDCFLRRRRPRRGRASLLARTAVAVWQAGRRLGYLAPIAVVAWKRPPQPHAMLSLLDHLASRWRSWGLGEVPSSLSCIMLTGGVSNLNKVVILVFEAGAPDPRLAVKAARLPQSERGLDREVASLKAVALGALPAIADVPSVVFDEVLGHARYVGETPVDGRPLLQILDSHSYVRLASDVTDVLASFPTVAHPAPLTTHWRRIIASVVDGFRARFGDIIDDADVDRLVARLQALPPLPTVPEHRDCSPWNVLVSDCGRLALLDWESAEPDGLPFLDLVYFLVNAGFLVDGTLGSGQELDTYVNMLDDSTGLLGRVFSDQVQRYAARLGVAPAAAVPLRSLAWMIHALSQYDDALPVASGQRVPIPPGRNVFVALWREDLRRLAPT